MPQCPHCYLPHGAVSETVSGNTCKIRIASDAWPICVHSAVPMRAQVRSISFPVLENQEDSREELVLNWALLAEQDLTNGKGQGLLQAKGSHLQRAEEESRESGSSCHYRPRRGREEKKSHSLFLPSNEHDQNYI